MPEEDRLRIIQSLKMVDYAMISIDYNRTVCTSLEFLGPQILQMEEIDIIKRFQKPKSAKDLILK